MSNTTTESLYRQYLSARDVTAIAEVFDRVAPSLLRLARRLARDESVAEDLVQDTFLVALERPDTYDARRPLLPWLLGILVHRARASRRWSSRHESGAIVLDSESGDAQAPEQATIDSEVRETVSAAVDELPESMRTVVRDVLLEDARASELAGKLSLSAGAVRVRLSRGLQRLRGLLPASLATALAVSFTHTRGMARVRSHVVGEARKLAQAKIAGASSGASLGGLGASTKLAALVVAAVIGGFAVREVTLRIANEGASTQREEEPVVSAPSAGPEATFAPPAASARASAEPAAPTGPGVLFVEVTREDGAQAASVLVRVQYWENGSSNESGERETTTDEAGQVRFEFPALVDIRSVIVPASQTMTAARTFVARKLRPGEEERVAIEIGAGESLAGRVVDESGQPIPGAEVLGWCGGRMLGVPDRRSTTDAVGRFVLEHLGHSFVATAHKDELVCSRGLRGKLEPGVPAEGLELVVTPGLTLRGVVRDPQGRAVADAEVEVADGLQSATYTDQTHVPGVATFRAGRGESRTDATGRFEIAGLPAHSSHLRVKHRPYLVYRSNVSPADSPIEVTLDPGLRLTGFVLESDGRPAAGAAVQFGPFLGNVQTVPSVARTDPSGHFELTCMNSERAGTPTWIAVLHAGHAVAVLQPVETSPDGGAPVTVQLEPENVVAGRVVDDESRGIAGVDLWIEGEREIESFTLYTRRNTWERSMGCNETATDADGNFRFGQLYPGRFRIHVQSSALEQREVTADVMAPAAGVEILMNAETLGGVELRGTVTDARTGVPIDDFQVQILRPMRDGPPWERGEANGTLTGPEHSFSSATGAYAISGLEPDEIQVAVSAAGYARVSSELREYERGVHDRDYALLPLRTLLVAVVDNKGKPVEHGRLQVFAANGERLPLPAAGVVTLEIRLHGEPIPLHALPAEVVTLRIDAADRIREVAVDLREPYEGVFEVNVAVDARAKLEVLLFGLGPDGDAAAITRRFDAIQTHAAAGREPEHRADGLWLKAQFEAGSLYFPRVLMEAVAKDETGRTLASATVKPIEGSGFAAETTWSSGDMQMGSTIEGFAPSFELHVPARDLVLHVRADGFEVVDLPITAAHLLDREGPLMLLLREQ